MGNVRDTVGKAGVVLASGFFRDALYVCVEVLILWIGR